jgi:hypothetical protein
LWVSRQSVGAADHGSPPSRLLKNLASISVS